MTSLESWKKALQNELKLTPEQLEARLLKKTIEGVFPILSTTRAHAHVIPNQTPWKKGSQTYLRDDPTVISSIEDDLQNGVRLFFLNAEAFNSHKISKITELLNSHTDSAQIEVVLLGSEQGDIAFSDLIHEGNSVSARQRVEQGATHEQELGAMTTELLEWVDRNPQAKRVHLFASVDEHFFQSIAKIRALREIAEKVFQELKRPTEIRIISYVNLRNFTLYERYNNLLRNTAAVGAALIGGADLIQSAGYMSIFEKELADDRQLETLEEQAHLLRSRRMARNTLHILSLESMLGLVEDASAGSYHLEMLTDQFAQSAWSEMQKLHTLTPHQREESWAQALKQTRQARMQAIESRKQVMSGVNDFANPQEKLGYGLPRAKSYRNAFKFETMRIRVEQLQNKPQVQIAVLGDLATLNARFNFAKNYFEILGLSVIEVASLNELKAGTIHVLCAKDEDYPQYVGAAKASSIAQYLAGKIEADGFRNIYAGQNVYSELASLLKSLGVKIEEEGV